MNKIIITIALAIVSFTSKAQTPAEDLANLKYYLYEAQNYLASARYYTKDSAQLISLLDGTDQALANTISYAETIVVPVDTFSPEEVSEVSNAEYEENTDYNNSGDYSGEDTDISYGGGPFEKMNPFKKIKSHFLVEVGINNFLKSSTVGIAPDINPGKSWFWNFGLVREVKVSKTFDFNFGITYLMHGFSFGNDVILSSDTDGNNPIFSPILNIKSDPCLRIHYLTVPISFDIKLSKNIKLNLGGQAGYRVYTSQNYSIRENSQDIEITRKDNFGLNNWMYGLRGGLGFDGWDLFFQYQLSDLFKDNQAQKYKIFMIGSSWRI